MYETVMCCAWIKSGIDFAAPTLWDGYTSTSASAALLTCVAFWFSGCGVWAIGIFRSVPMDHWSYLYQPLAWLIAGIAYIVSVILGYELTASCCTLPAASALAAAGCWITAAVFWLLAGTIIKPTSVP